MQCFPSQNQERLPEGLKRIFEHIGGIPQRLKFDDLFTAVVKVPEDPFPVFRYEGQYGSGG